MKIRLLIIGLFIFVIGVGLIFYRLGGMNKPSISRAIAPKYMVIGKVYNGKINQKFDDFQAQLQEDAELFTGDFILIYNQNPNQANIDLKVFGGFLTQDTTQIPQGYQLQQVPKREVIRATINSHPLVTPSATQVETELVTFAKERSIVLQEKLLEKYTRNQNQVITEIPVKP